MTREFALPAALARAVADRRGAWHFIEGFAAAWDVAREPGHGVPEAELRAAEARLGLRLPRALREAYLLIGRHAGLTGNHDRLLAPAEWYVEDGALVIRTENQGAASWGTPLADAAREDPPLRVRPDLADKAAEEWQPWLDPLSLAFVELVLSESLHAGRGLTDFLEQDEGTLPLLRAHATRLPFPDYPHGGLTRWYLAGDVLLRDDGGAALLARARTPEALRAFRALVPGDWLEDSC
ncbi:SMI1/KNR4 family protein [Streptomyces sp. P6-2-1]|uniref:SMI1/KNR4 family protein n=1 Tax=Streptomyces sp. P6-2-1 TaxID=3422591 RepID=UPI003D36285B